MQPSVNSLPAPIGQALTDIGLGLRAARLRRRETARDFAARIGVSLPTLRHIGGAYAEIARFLHRHGARHMEDRRLLFRRMVFNVLIGNRDDHLKNLGCLFKPSQGRRLTPAFEVLPQPDMEPMQAIGLGRSGPFPSRDNCLSQCAEFGLSTAEAGSVIDELREAAADWPRRFAEMGAYAATIRSIGGAFMDLR